MGDVEIDLDHVTDGKGKSYKPYWLTLWQQELKDKPRLLQEEPIDYLAQAREYLMTEASKRCMNPVDMREMEFRCARMDKQMWRHANDEFMFRNAVVMALGMELDMHEAHLHVALEESRRQEKREEEMAEAEVEKRKAAQQTELSKRMGEFSRTWDAATKIARAWRLYRKNHPHPAPKALNQSGYRYLAGHHKPAAVSK